MNNTMRKELFLGWPGCSDHNCVVTGPKKGMGTNGGCHCIVGASRSKLALFSSRLQRLLSTEESTRND